MLRVRRKKETRSTLPAAHACEFVDSLVASWGAVLRFCRQRSCQSMLVSQCSYESVSYGSALEYRLCAQALNNSGDGKGQRTVHGAAAGAFGSAAHEMFGHSGDIHFPLAPQADSKAAVGRLAEKYGDLT